MQDWGLITCLVFLNGQQYGNFSVLSEEWTSKRKKRCFQGQQRLLKKRANILWGGCSGGMVGGRETAHQMGDVEKNDL